jgi:hypothetical protein
MLSTLWLSWNNLWKCRKIMADELTMTTFSITRLRKGFKPGILELFLFSWGEVRMSPLGTSATNWPIVPAPDVRRWWWMGTFGGTRIGRGSGSTRVKPAPVPLCPSQIPHDLAFDRTLAAGVKIRRLTAWNTVRPSLENYTKFWPIHPKILFHR